ncbi:MAG: Tol biopolymer transport system component [Paraglaciecola sp.]|jgi:Tol biopolymer transport system component
MVSSNVEIHTNLSEKTSANDGMPSFSKDGKSIVFRSGRSGSFDLYVMPVDKPDKTVRNTDGKVKIIFMCCRRPVMK